MKLLGEAGIPAGAVLDTNELNKGVTFEQCGIIQTMVHPVHRPFKMSDWLGLSAQAVVAFEGRRRALICAANQLPPRALRRSSPWDFHHWCSIVMSVPKEKCRTPMSRKYFA